MKTRFSQKQKDAFHREYRKMITYLESPEYARQLRRDYERAVADCNLFFCTDYTPENFLELATGGVYEHTL